MNIYEPIIPKEKLIHGAYYKGECRNAGIARWNKNEGVFYYWRTKFGSKFIETIACPEDEQYYDVFVAEELIENPKEEIYFDSE